MTKGIHRVTSNSKTGRRLNSRNYANQPNRDPEIEAWNREVERKKEEKLKRSLK